jgi:hypothetical protein
MTKPAASNAPPIMRRRIPGFTTLLNGMNYYCVAFEMACMLGGCEAENSLAHRQNPEVKTSPDSNSLDVMTLKVSRPTLKHRSI